jgi:hypothetical protein
MKLLRGAILALYALTLAPFAAHAQTSNALVVSACNGKSYTAGLPAATTQTTGGQFCIAPPAGGTTAVVGNQSNAGAGTTGSQNLGTNAYGYGWTGSAWGQVVIDSSGRYITVGPETTGSALVGGGLRIMGSDGTDARDIATNASGQVVTVGAGTAGAPASGVATVQGSTATGSALASDPVLVGGSDGTDVRNIATNASGQVVTVGAGTAGTPATGVATVQGSTATGSALASDPLLVAGSDGTDVRNISTDAGGRTIPGQNCTSVINIAQTTSTDVHTSTAKLHICSIVLVSATAQSIGIDEGTGTTCETGGTALIGVSSTSSATPQIALAANGGFSSVGGIPWLQTTTTADHLCVLQSGSGEVAGTITYSDY